MHLHTPAILSFSASDNDPVFKNTILLITLLDKNGAIGFIINKIFPRKLNELTAFSNAPPFPLYAGGPVADTELFFIHQRPDIIRDGNAIDSHLYFGGDFEQGVAAIREGRLTTNDIKIFIGYCGWDKGELETELQEGSWLQSGLKNPFLMY